MAKEGIPNYKNEELPRAVGDGFARKNDNTSQKKLMKLSYTSFSILSFFTHLSIYLSIPAVIPLTRYTFLQT